MKLIDLLLLLPLAYGAYTGFRRGVLVELIAVVAFVVSLLLGFKLLNEAIAFLAPHVGESISRRFLPYVGFSGIFITTIFLINRFGWLLRKSLRYTIFGSFDSMAGAVVGVFTYAFGLSVFFWLLVTLNINFPKSQQTAESYVYPVIRPLAPKLMSKLADSIPRDGKLVDRVEHEWGQWR